MGYDNVKRISERILPTIAMHKICSMQHHDNAIVFLPIFFKLQFVFPPSNSDLSKSFYHNAARQTTGNKKVHRNSIEITVDLVPVAGVEPARCRHRGILSPVRLPIPSHRRASIIINAGVGKSKNFFLRRRGRLRQVNFSYGFLEASESIGCGAHRVFCPNLWV